MLSTALCLVYLMETKHLRIGQGNKLTQGKDERSHRTWKEKMKYDVINSDGELNWVENLPIYQQLYNESPHSSLGMQSPFEVYYGRQPNRFRN